MIDVCVKIHNNLSNSYQEIRVKHTYIKLMVGIKEKSEVHQSITTKFYGNPVVKIFQSTEVFQIVD